LPAQRSIEPASIQRADGNEYIVPRFLHDAGPDRSQQQEPTHGRGVPAALAGRGDDAAIPMRRVTSSNVRDDGQRRRDKRSRSSSRAAHDAVFHATNPQEQSWQAKS
jgi:hypothetical protein